MRVWTSMKGNKMKRVTKRWLSVGAVAAALLATTACGSSSSNGPGKTSGGGKIGPDVLTLDQMYTGTYTAPPSTSPAGAKGKSVWWISCGQALASCAEPAEQAGQAAKVLGIDFHVADSNSNIGGAEATAIRTAISSGADAILVYGGGGCEGAQGALQEAKDKGILLMGVETPDCSDSGGPKLFDVVENYSEKYPDTKALWMGYGEFAADFAIRHTDGKAKIIFQDGNTGSLEKYLTEGFVGRIDSNCPGCEIVEKVKYVDSDLSPDGPWVQAFRGALVKHPDANAVYLPWDFMMAGLNGAQAVKDAGLNAIIFGGQADTTGLDVLRQGRITALTTARSTEWSAYAAIDTINRALQGETTFPPEGIGYQLVDKNKNLAAKGAYEPPIDFKAAYLKAWNNGEGTE